MTTKLRTIKATELAPFKDPAHGDHWGPWRYDTKRQVLDYEANNCHYEVDLETCDTNAGVLDWICQCAGKSWMSVGDLGHLVRAIDAIIRPQATLCSFGISQERTEHATKGQ